MTHPKSISGHHHVTSCVGGAKEDFAFHTQVLGLKCVKKTLLYDGPQPIYHLYYANDVGEEGTILTTFPMRHLGLKSRPGVGCFSAHDVAIPASSFDWWKDRMRRMGVEATESERFGERRLKVSHPGGIFYDLCTVADDDRTPPTSHDVPRENALRGTHGITLPCRDLEDQAFFMEMAWGAEEVARDGRHVRYRVGEGDSGHFVDLAVTPDGQAGQWTFGEGNIHHCAFQVPDLEAQKTLKFHIEGLGFTDTSDVKDRGYFWSIYVRSPAGALFEATVSKGFTEDEPIDALGRTVMMAPQLEGSREEILANMEPLE